MIHLIERLNLGLELELELKGGLRLGLELKRWVGIRVRVRTNWLACSSVEACLSLLGKRHVLDLDCLLSLLSLFPSFSRPLILPLLPLHPLPSPSLLPP